MALHLYRSRSFGEVRSLDPRSRTAALAQTASRALGANSVTKLIDYSINPCEDFYQYACGAWHKDAVIPPDKHDIDTSFHEINIKSEAVLANIFADNTTKLGAFYNSCLDTATLSSLGVTPLEDSFKAIRSARTKLDLLIVAGELAKNGIHAFVDISSRADDDSTKNILFAYAPPLSLGRTFYTNPSEWKFVEAEYKEYIATVLQLAGYTTEQAAAAVPVIIRFEQTLVGVAHRELKDMEAVVSPYTALTYSQLNQKYPLLVGSWLKAHGFDIYDQWGGSNDWVGFLNLNYFDTTEELLKNTPLDNLRTIVEFRLIHSSSKHLTPEFSTANWNLFGKKIYGQKVETSREDYCLSETSKTLRDLMGQYFIDAVLSAGAAKKADDLLYPTLTFDSKSYLNNRWKVSQVNIDTDLKLNGQPVEKRKFNRAPHEANPYYNPHDNAIVFPAAILQKPFFDGQFDAAQNFGAIGMVIGHEITHGFDKSGRRVDGDGNLKQWWSNATNDAFKTKAQCFIDQYSNIVVKSEVTDVVLGNISGKDSLNENIADNGGLKTSFRAYHEYLEEFPSQYTEEAGDKLFYLSFAQSACSKNTDAFLLRSLKQTHPRGRYRVTGALQNNAEFARVFQCPTDSYLNPSKKCLLWE
ncbi:hypothetical protein DYB31_009382 [Aphanomyces astaci]|uniref:Peptidase M13 C-terminal domain-containing protein n=1 Tax=Aphanomyces astaci TaxID=112090 RepID=A0A397FCL5_APHAT|nr:hypothetical protein DYB31_009382 [Aphanomyces astaci]